MAFQYKTRKMKNPRGLQKVFFSCCTEDFNTYFEKLSDLILKYFDCAIWYQREDGTVNEKELNDFQLFVLLVSDCFLDQDCDSRLVYLPYAKEHNVPLLLVSVQNGIERAFGEKVGNYQLLAYNNDDPTELPFEIKLKNFLEEVLVGPDLIAKIRSIFDAYIFMSYRKMDRAYAQRLMKLIHRNEHYKNIAIWYDEFLTPGECFDDEIENALAKSKLFALVVTPNLVESKYITEIEYPSAQKLGKKIIPIAMDEVDVSQLKKFYDSLPDIVDGNSQDDLVNALSSAIDYLAISESETSPEHNYFLGVAYLNGIDVEIDYGRAFELISCAAESGITPAMKKLSQMYKNGQGAEKNFESSIIWWKKFICTLEEELKNIDEDSLRIYIADEKHKLGDYLQVYGQYEKAEIQYIESVEYINIIQDAEWNRTIQELLFYNKCRIADTYFQRRDPITSAEKYLEAKQYLEVTDICTEPMVIDLLERVVIAYDVGNRTIDSYKASVELLRYKENDNWQDDEQKSRSLMNSVAGIAKSLFTLGRLEESLEYYLREIELYTDIISKWGTEEDTSNLVSKKCFLGRTCCDVYKRYDIAQKLYLETLEYYKRAYDNSTDLRSRYEEGTSLVGHYVRLGESIANNGDRQNAIQYFGKANEVSEILAPLRSEYMDLECTNWAEEMLKEIHKNLLDEYNPIIQAGLCGYAREPEATNNMTRMTRSSREKDPDDLMFNIQAKINTLMLSEEVENEE